ncbi:MAG: BamA/TamA family outer membrane protein [Bacteroidota bacterium]
MGLFRGFLLLSVILLYHHTFLLAQNNDIAVVGKIFISGNRVTRESIVMRELEFNTGDTITKDGINGLVDKSRRNLLNLPLFHFVTIGYHGADEPGIIDFDIVLTERWYTWLWPVFELSDRNFNAWIQNGDMTRLSYGLFLQQENFRGRMEKLHLKIKLGYQQEAFVLYEKPYLNRQKTLGAGIQTSFSRQRETGYITENDRLVFYRADDYLLQTTDLAVFVRYRPDIHFSHTLQLRYNTLKASDSLLHLNRAYTINEEVSPDYFELSYLMKADFRDQRAYPLNGWYAEASLAKTGLYSGDSYDFISAKLLMRFYHRFDRNWHFAGSFTTRFTTDADLPYYLSQALGYRHDYVRGYEYFVVDGNNFWLAKVNMKFALLKPAVKKLIWPPSERFNTIPYALYLGAFADGGKVWPAEIKNHNRFPGDLLKGIGIGLDFVTYYDKVIRAEFSINANGNSGFFLHFMAAI